MKLVISNKAPKLRFKHFSDCWEEKKFHSIAQITMGQSPDSDSYSDNENDLPLIQGKADIKNRLSFPQKRTSKPSKTCSKGSILMTVRAPVGSVAKSVHHACIGRGICSINPSINTDFVYQFLIRNEDKWRHVEQGSTFSAINKDDISDIAIYVPSLDEQAKIANFFALIDERISNQEQIIENLEQLKKGYMQKIFSQQLRFKDENGVDFPEWEDIQLGELGQFYNGLSGKSKEHFVNGSHPYISYMEVFSNSILHNTANNMVKIFDNEFQNKVSFGDVLFTQSSETLDEIGMSSVWLNRDFEPYLNSFCFGLRINQEIAYPSFMGYLLRTMDTRQKIIKEGQGITRVNISSNRLRNINILLPSLDEQRKIATFFMLLDKKIEFEKSKLLNLKKQKLGYLQQMFV